MVFDRANITKSGTDDQDVRLQQYSKNGDVDDAEIYAPYGISYNVPPGSLCLFAQIGGDDGNIILLPDRSQDRVKNLAESEVAIGNPISKSNTIYKKNGNIVTVTEGDVGDIELTIQGKVTIVVAGNVDLKATTVNIDATTTNIGVGGLAIARLGDTVQVTGVQSGGSTATGTITSAGVNTSI